MSYRIPEAAGDTYRPSNGTEGAWFEETYCEQCFRFECGGCKILGNALCFRVTDPEYPKEWVYDAEGRPRCTAFVLGQEGA